VAVARHHARQGLDLDVGHRRALDLREAADLRLRKADVVQRARRQAGDAGVDLRGGQAKAFWRPLVELGAELMYWTVTGSISGLAGGVLG